MSSVSRMKAEIVLESDRATLERQDLGAHTGLIDHASSIFVQGIEHEHPVKSLQVMEQNNNGAFPLLGVKSFALDVVRLLG